MIEFKIDTIERLLRFPNTHVLLLLLAFFRCPLAKAFENELEDVWHHDLGVARISQYSESPVSSITSRNHELINVTNTSQRVPKGSDGPKLGEPEATSDDSGACDFRGRRLRVAVCPQPPFVSCLQDLYGDWHCNGSNIELIHVLEHRFNFKADWVVLTNNHMEDDLVPILSRSGPGSKPARAGGRQRPNNNSIGGGGALPQPMGIFSLVSSGRALLSANGVMKTMDRSGQSLMVSEPFDSFRLHFLLSKSVRDHDHIFIKPFDANAWIAILSSAALVVPVFYFINTTTAYYNTRDDRHLDRVSVRQCWDHCRALVVNRLLSKILPRAARSVSITSTDALLEHELGKVMQIRAITTGINVSPSPLPLPPPPVSDRSISTVESSFVVGASSANLVRQGPLMSPPVLRGESERKRRLARRQWAYERRRARKLSRLKRKSGFFNAAYVVWYVVASLANQGGETEDLPRADSTRILIAFWWLYLIVICAIHSGILTAILTFPKQNDFIQTLDDYLNLEPRERNHLHLAVDKYSELAHLLIDSDNLHKSPLQELQKQHVPISYVNFQRHRQRVLDEVQLGLSAFIEEKSFITQIITHEYFDSKQTKCAFKASRYPIDVIPMSLLLSDRMPRACVDSLNALLRRVMKTGLAQKWRRKFESPGNDCLNTVVINAGDVDKIELKHVVLAFWLLALGACAGLLFLALEIVWLFTVDDEDDDDDNEDYDDADNRSSLSDDSTSSSSSSSSLMSVSSDESDRVKLGFKRALMPAGSRMQAIRSLKSRNLPIKAILRKTKRNQKRTMSGNAPKITFALDEPLYSGGEETSDSPRASSRILVLVDEREGLREVREFYSRRSREKRDKRTAREASKRARRIKKTVDLVKKIHGGKMYSERIQNRLRRMSHSIATHLHAHSRHNHHATESSHLATTHKGHLTVERRESSATGDGILQMTIFRSLGDGSSRVVPIQGRASRY